MKRFLSVFFASAAIGLAAMPADATLINRGGGLIYDDDLNITWLQDANYAMTSGYDANGSMSWADAVTWADTLVYGGYSDWRLPTVVPQNYKIGFKGTTGFGFNITTGSEMGHLFYTELNNLGYQATNGTYPQPGWGLTNTGPFINLQPYHYWSGTEYAPNTYGAWDFYFGYGIQYANYKYSTLFALAVRPGDSVATSVPEPGTVMLMGSGLVGLIAARKMFLLRHR